MQVAPTTPPRRWFRYSLRTFLIVVVVASVALGWLAKTIDRVRRQRAAVAAITSSGGEVRYDYQMDPNRGRNPTPPGPWLLRRLIGDDAFADVTYVQWLSASPADRDIETLTKLPAVEYVLLHSGRATNRSLEYLIKLPKLTGLSLGGTRVTCEGLKRLKSAPALSELGMSGPAVTNECLKAIAGLDELSLLNLLDATIDDNGLRHLASLTDLQELSINRTPGVTGEGLKYFAQPERIRVLQLVGVPITDHFMQYVARMRKLQKLTLIETLVTEDGLRKLDALPELTEVRIGYAPIGDAGVASILRPGLIRLEIPGTQVTDAVVSRIAEAEGLLLLDIGDTAITDASVQELSKCKSLMRLELGPNVSVEAAKKLKAAIPACHIQLSDDTSSQEIKLP